MRSNYNTTLVAIRRVLSSAHMATYEQATKAAEEDESAALKLYAWNAAVSGALLAPLHICEVSLRNAVSEALEIVYGPDWPWSATFERSLPDPAQGYSPRKDLQSARRPANSTGKVIPELKFVFWQKMLTGRFDGRLWDQHLQQVLPNMDASQSVSQQRQILYNGLEQLRKLRNRIAHHEPIFNRNLIDDYQKILELVGYRCTITASWLNQNQTVTQVIIVKPAILDHSPHA